MTASPAQYRDQAPAWFVTTDQGVVLSAALDDEASARSAGNEVAERLRQDMRREGFPETAVRERVAALRVGFGTLERPHGGFIPWPS